MCETNAYSEAVFSNIRAKVLKLSKIWISKTPSKKENRELKKVKGLFFAEVKHCSEAQVTLQVF